MLIAVIAFIWVLYRIGQSTEWAQPDPNYSDETFIQAFFLTQLFNSGAIAMNWALWSLSAEWFGNLSYIPLTAFKKNVGIVAGIVIGYVALWYGLNHDQEFIGDSWSVGSGPIAHWEAYGRMMAEFGFGLLVRKYLPELSRFRNHWFMALSIALAVVLLWSHSVFQGDTVYWTTYFAGPVFAYLILQASAYNPSVENWLGSSLSWLGKMSFGIYAYHVVILIAYDQIVPQPDAFPGFGSSTWAKFLLTKIVVTSVIAIVLAYQTNRLVEGPIQRLGKRALKRL
jgi:peptidoglycan/LPS O-acetylase OafA/YrhL